MTENEAKDFVQGKLDCMNKCDVFDCKGTDECDNCQYCYSQGNFGEQKKSFETAIQALEEISLYKQGGLCLIPTEVYGKQCETLDNYKEIGTVEEVKLLQTFKELYEAYNVIGTIAEFRDLKANKKVIPIATITINKEDMQKMIDEKVAQIELDIQAIRNKAIDEFAEALRLKCLDNVYREVGIHSILKITEQLKGGVE